jgi:glycogen operon protein
MIEHLRSLGVTAIELMPVHQFVNDSTLIEKGLSNYWGYNTIGSSRPHNAYSSCGSVGEQVLEFKAMVRDLTEPASRSSSTSSTTTPRRATTSARPWRSAASTTRPTTGSSTRPPHYYDTTGTGNTLLMRSPHVCR